MQTKGRNGASTCDYGLIQLRKVCIKQFEYLNSR